MNTRKGYPTDIGDEEWAFVAPYLTLMKEDAPQREHCLREVFNGLRYIIKAGATWRMMPNDLPPWEVVYQQTQRWMKAGVFAAIVDDLRMLLRLDAGRAENPSAVSRPSVLRPGTALIGCAFTSNHSTGPSSTF